MRLAPEERHKSLFSGDSPVVLARRAKGRFHSQSVRGFLGAIGSREYLIASSGWFSAWVKAAKPLLNVEVEKMTFNKGKT